MIWFHLLLIFSFFVCNSSWKLFHRGRGRYGNLGEPGTNSSSYNSYEKYFDQKLDHFDPSNGQTWKQRYLENDRYFELGGPFFLMIGGEGALGASWISEGTWVDYAKKYKAYLFMVEHRFYGKSHPTDDLSVKNLAFLSSEQALSDLAFFITSMNEKFNIFPKPKWIVFGGSYPGSLASWMRLKYPHLVHAAVSSSGPLLALPNFRDYFKVVKESLSHYNPECVSAIINGTKHISSKISSSEGRKALFKHFQLCDELDFNNEDDISNFYETLAGNFAGIVQYDNDYRKSKSGVLPISIKNACDIMLNKSIGCEMKRLAEVNAALLKQEQEKCLDFKYDEMIKKMRAVDWDSEVANGMRQWTYQTCTEFGFFQTSDLNSTQEMFADKFPVDFFIKQCSDIFGVKFDKNLLNEGIKRTNMIYGGLDDYANNVVYVHGSIDPWHAIGITKTLRKGAPAIYIYGTAHCANMYPSRPNDLPQLVLARNHINKLIGDWLAQ